MIRPVIAVICLSCLTGNVQTIDLVPVKDQAGAGRYWFHASYWPEISADCPAPVFTVSPPIWIESWFRDPFYGWIAGEPGVYTVTATGCEVEGSLVIVVS